MEPCQAANRDNWGHKRWIVTAEEFLKRDSITRHWFPSSGRGSECSDAAPETDCGVDSPSFHDPNRPITPTHTQNHALASPVDYVRVPHYTPLIVQKCRIICYFKDLPQWFSFRLSIPQWAYPLHSGPRFWSVVSRPQSRSRREDGIRRHADADWAARDQCGQLGCRPDRGPT